MIAMHDIGGAYQGALHHLDIKDHRDDVLDALVEIGAGLLLLRLIRSRLGGGGSGGGIIVAIVDLNEGVLVVLGLELVSVGPLVARLVRKLRAYQLDWRASGRARTFFMNSPLAPSTEENGRFMFWPGSPTRPQRWKQMYPPLPLSGARIWMT